MDIKVIGKSRVWLPLHFTKEGRWCDMSTYQAITLMIAFGMFTISLISYLDRNNNQKK
ncbi:MAG: putative holin-like toxin [Geosporobacter ferrireducens]|nr:putative holin-like toxin [Geosporobacter ferrireducens]